MFLPIGILLAAALLLATKKKKPAAGIEPLTSKPVAVVQSPIETTTKAPSVLPTVKAPVATVKNPVVNVGSGTIGDVLFGPVRQAQTTPKPSTQSPPIVATSPGKTLGDTFWGAVRK